MIYGGTAKTNLEMIENAEKKLKAIFFKKRRDSLTESIRAKQYLYCS